MRPRLATRAGSSACVIAIWPNTATSNWRFQSGMGSTSIGASTAMPALFTRARSGRPAGSVRMR